jgi:hypothetical protein
MSDLKMEPGGRPDWIESVEERAEAGQWTRFAVGFVVGQLFVVALWFCLVVLAHG